MTLQLRHFFTCGSLGAPRPSLPPLGPHHTFYRAWPSSKRCTVEACKAGGLTIRPTDPQSQYIIMPALLQSQTPICPICRFLPKQARPQGQKYPGHNPSCLRLLLVKLGHLRRSTAICSSECWPGSECGRARPSHWLHATRHRSARKAEAEQSLSIVETKVTSVMSKKEVVATSVCCQRLRKIIELSICPAVGIWSPTLAFQTLTGQTCPGRLCGDQA